MGKKSSDLLKIILIFAAIFIGCYFLVRYFEFRKTKLSPKLSIENEISLGSILEESIEREFDEIHDTQTDSALKVITDRLVSGIGYTPYHYDFRIIDSPEINAFTIPGGNIYVFSGLLGAARTPEEVAAVLAHEIGHAEKRHTVTKLVNELSIAVLVSVATGGDPSVVTQIIQQSVNNTFSREAEEEADQYALQLLETTQINPGSLALFFQQLNDGGLSYDKRLEFLMTHPHNDSRIEKAREYQPKTGFESKPFELDWQTIREKYKGEEEEEED